MSNMEINVVSTQFGQTIDGFDDVFDAGEVVMTLKQDDMRILLPMKPDLAEMMGKALVIQARKARGIKRKEASESILRASQEGK